VLFFEVFDSSFFFLFWPLVVSSSVRNVTFQLKTARKKQEKKKKLEEEHID